MQEKEEQTCPRVKKIETREERPSECYGRQLCFGSESYRYSFAAIQTPGVLGHQPAETLCVVTQLPFHFRSSFTTTCARASERANGHTTLVAFYFANSRGNDDAVQNSRKVGSKI